MTEPASAEGWEQFPHGADAGVRGFGPTLDSAFEQVALALTAAITEVGSVHPEDCVSVECEAPTKERLLVAWLNDLIFEMATRQMLFGRFTVHIDGERLTGEACGEPVAIARHQPAAEAKGATFTELKVDQGDDGRWRAQCVIDV